MKFGPLALEAAEGAILAHSLALPDGRLRKGARLDAAALARLRAAGMAQVTAAQLEPGDLHEDAAAARLARALVPDPQAAGLTLGPAATGRVNIHASGPGVVGIAADRIHAVNALDPMITVATVPEWQRMTARGMVATVKIISYAVPGAVVEAACAAGRDALRLHGPVRPRVHLVETRIAGAKPLPGQAVIAARVERLGGALCGTSEVPHDETALAGELARLAGAGTAQMVLVLTGSATSDPGDVGPAALLAAGGRLERFGMPVDPGNLMFLGRLGEIPVLGLPGSSRSPALSGGDWILERLLCGVDPTGADIARMGLGGLLKEIPTRPQPREPRPARDAENGALRPGGAAEGGTPGGQGR